MKTLSNLPPKGTYDWFPDEYKIRKYIFDAWREVCTQFGYKEYLTPIVENAEVYRAKSGEDVAGPELMVIKKEDEELAIRPEMTPSVTRMVTRFYESQPKPIRLFSIANFMRFQKPQRGRNREFWQLNYDVFGSDSIKADIEILQIALEIMLKFSPPEGSFTLFVNNRKLIDFILDTYAAVSPENKVEVVRVLDKFDKMPVEEFKKRLFDLGLKDIQIDSLLKFINCRTADALKESIPGIVENQGFLEVTQMIETLEKLGYGKWIKFQPNIIRGFDYYDGMVFEVFDNNPKNSRSLFGGGRYNGLASVFGSKSFPAVGCAPGDETIRLFLEGWDLLKNIENKKTNSFYIPLLGEELVLKTNQIAGKLRLEGNNVEGGLEVQKLSKALDYANKIKCDFVVIFGEEEEKKGVYIIRNMSSGEQKEVQL